MGGVIESNNRIVSIYLPGRCDAEKEDDTLFSGHSDLVFGIVTIPVVQQKSIRFFSPSEIRADPGDYR